MSKKPKSDNINSITSDEKVVSSVISIDGVNYKLENLSELLKNQIASLRATDSEIARQEAMLAMLKTARSAYARAIKLELENIS